MHVFHDREANRSCNAQASSDDAAPSDVELPAPKPLVPEHDFTVYMTGIGGTGVVTVNQVLGTAAAMAGRSVRTLDLFGGSQRRGRSAAIYGSRRSPRSIRTAHQPAAPTPS